MDDVSTPERETVLVAGGAGYVGAHTCKALFSAGYRPVTLDNLSTGHAWMVKWGPLEQIDVRDGDGLAAVVRRHRPIAIMHFCAFSLVGPSLGDPLATYENNLLGTMRLLAAAQTLGVPHMIFSSTAAVYGQPEQVPIREDAPVVPINPYGASKAMCERLLADTESAGGPSYTALRYFNAAGADPDLEIGEAHSPETHLIPLAIKACLDPDFELAVFGDDYDTPDGTAVRDYIHVCDLADAHVLALQRLQAGDPSEVLNLGIGQGHSVHEVIESVERVAEALVKRNVKARRAGDPPILVADGQRARSELGWRPRWPDLDGITASALAWHRRVPVG